MHIALRTKVFESECEKLIRKRYCEEDANRRFKARFWRPITIKIAIQ